VHGKGGRSHTILLDDPALVALIRRYLRITGYRRGPLSRATKNHIGGPLRYASAQELWAKYNAAAGDDIELHQLRHTHATELVNDGVSLQTIRKRLGHRKIQTTLGYANPRELHRPGEVREVCPGSKGPNAAPTAQCRSFVTWGYARTSPCDARLARQAGKIIQAKGPPRAMAARPAPARARGGNLRVWRPDGLEEHQRGDRAGPVAAHQLRHSDSSDTRLRH